jgi:FkbM family methyltransferase
MQTTETDQDTSDEESDPERLRAEQSACYEAEDFARYFALSKRLAEACQGYARSYEFWVHTVLHTLAHREPDLFFLQVGAMDGKRFDPIYAFVKRYGWKGLVLEPLPDLFEALAANYAGSGNVTLVNAALTETDGERDMVRVRRQAVLDGTVPVWTEGLGSFFPERNALGGVGVGPELHAAILGHTQRERVACLTLRSLAAIHGLQRLDLLQVDAEGCELEILRQVARCGYRPRVIHLEYWALPARERGELLGLLGEQGYRMRMGESDVMAVAPDLQAIIEAQTGWSC